MQFLDRHCGDREDATHYLGFTTLRPLASAPVGRTVMRAPRGRNHSYATVSDKVSTKLAGAQLKTDAAPFIQQDSAVGACAQAAMWMAMNALSRRHRKEPKTLADITRVATATMIAGRVLPSRDGLSQQQIARALHEFGYHGHSIPLVSKEGGGLPKGLHVGTRADNVADQRLGFIRASIHPYLESGVPVILAVRKPGEEGHAILLIGYSWDASPTNTSPLIWWQAEHAPSIHFASPATWVEGFMAHDDSAGPYASVARRGTRYTLEDAQLAFPVLHQLVHMTAAEALSAGCSKLDILIRDLRSQQELVVTGLAACLLVRPLLQQRHEFRRWAARRCTGELALRYRTMFLPEYLWVLELHAQDAYRDALSKQLEPLRLGEMLIDATGDPLASPIVSVHLNNSAIRRHASRAGVLLDYTTDENKVVLVYLQDDDPVPSIALHSAVWSV